ncbi:uncharacterized protein LOC135486864 [Lineus longissimus]|uniref:uncharacterized protein LOC135486864 n=1 Tax=Lineus longissimus TaxID=88925 RepID=UPI002B4C27D0
MKPLVFKITSIILILVCVEALLIEVDGVEFSFKRYPYKKKQKNEKKYKNIIQRCEEDPECALLTGLEQTKCLRQCASPTCYDELYVWDELEDGEIDVRLPSFKGCVLQNQPISV